MTEGRIARRRPPRPALLRDTRGVALMELALALPLLLFAILGLLELSNYALQRQRLSQVALQVADNAGRMGDISMAGASRISEQQITDVLLGGVVQGGSLTLPADGRIILSSLELNQNDGQWIHWQRCRGDLVHSSSFGAQGDGSTGNTLTGMGTADAKIRAEKGHPVMFVEVAYRMTPLVLPEVLSSRTLIETAAMPIRVDRDTSEVNNKEGASPSLCH